MKLANWGNYPKIEGEVVEAADVADLSAALQESKRLIPRGMGRSYGDSSLGERVLSTTALNHFLKFDEERGILECEAGTTLADIIDAFVPRGWFLPVSPGTRFVTVGGAVAADVHGKNHHVEGTFCDHVLGLGVLLTDGRKVTCGPRTNEALFRATCGGMGLTGVITTVKFKLKEIPSAYIKQTSIRANNLDTVFELFEKYQHHTYSVAWVDCLARGRHLGRSVLLLGEHAQKSDLKDRQKKHPWHLPKRRQKNVPVELPTGLLNKYSLRLFNSLYYHMHKRGLNHSIVDLDKFFYPLDALGHWNRVYGKNGFLQYQFVLPRKASAEGMKAILHEISEAGLGSFLAVLKLFGPANKNLLSFPMEGYTLALDFPVSARVLSFLDELDELVMQYGGRIYLAKDSRMTAETLHASYGSMKAFRAAKKKFDRAGKLSSAQSVRLEVS